VVQLRSWGKLCPSECELQFLDRYRLEYGLKNGKKYLVQGSARSYGDVCLNTHHTIIKSSNLNFFKSFDAENGILICEAGVILKDIQDTFLPRGWLLPVSPGTQLITVGGAIANDIHGKNHHIRGNFGHHILELSLLRSDGQIYNCSRTENTELFRATIGGIGLTGIILSAKIQLMPVSSPVLQVEYLPFRGISEFLRINSESENKFEYTVSWIDCLSGKNVRGIFIRANHVIDQINLTPVKKQQKKIPITPPISCINILSLKLFNQFYYNLNAQKKGKKYQQHFYDFQYPLDGIENWNVLYGKKGFYQYQCVIPLRAAQDPIEKMLELIAKSQQGSFLVVLKAFGNIKNEGMLSFPISGITLALDFPNLGEKTLKLFKQLDQIVLDNLGRLYLAKDARMDRKFFIETYPQVLEFEKFRDPAISSDMALRLLGKI
jgi:FAD/FMN-containing dehydrogenase